MQGGPRGRGPGAVAALRLPVLRGVGGGVVRGRSAGLPRAAARGARAGAAAALAAAQACGVLRVQGMAGQSLLDILICLVLTIVCLSKLLLTSGIFFFNIIQRPVAGNRNNIREKQQECEEEKAIA